MNARTGPKPSRLDRDFGRKKWGDEGYAMEELVAELSAACASLELTPEPREEHASYLDHWPTVLRRVKRAIFQAAKLSDACRKMLPVITEHTTARSCGRKRYGSLLGKAIQQAIPATAAKTDVSRTS